MNADPRIEIVAVEPAQSEDRIYARKLAEMQADALPTIRSTAEKWAGSITSLLGVVGLAALFTNVDKFDGLENPEQWLGKGAFFAAVALALLAAAFATSAAQSTAAKVFLPSRTQYAQFTDDEAKEAIGKLTASRWLAVAAAAAVLVSAALVWWGRETASTPTVIQLQGTSLCEDGATGTATAEDATYVIRC